MKLSITDNDIRKQFAIGCLPPTAWTDTLWPLVPIPPYEPSSKTIACHEAAHAVICLLIGIPITEAAIKTDQVSLGEDENVLGAVSTDQEVIAYRRQRQKPSVTGGAPNSTDKARLYTLLIGAMYFAGRQAELIERGISVAGAIYAGDDDQVAAFDILREHFGTINAEYYCQRLARLLLMDHWPLVDAVAVALQKSGRLTVDQIIAVMAAVDPDQAGPPSDPCHVGICASAVSVATPISRASS